MRDYEEYTKDKIIEFLSQKHEIIKIEPAEDDPPDYWLYIEGKKIMLEVTSVTPLYYNEDGTSMPRRSVERFIEQFAKELEAEFSEILDVDHTVLITLYMPIKKTNLSSFKEAIKDKLRIILANPIYNEVYNLVQDSEQARIKLADFRSPTGVSVMHMDKPAAPSVNLDIFTKSVILDRIREKQKKIEKILVRDNIADNTGIYLGLYIAHPMLEIDDFSAEIKDAINNSLFNKIFVIIENKTHEFPRSY